MSTETATTPRTERLAGRLARWLVSLRRTLPVLQDFLVNAVGQVRIWHDVYAGIMHGLIFWGVTIQIVGTAMNLMQMQLFVPFVELPFPRGRAYLSYELVMDLAGIFILLGVFMSAFRRGVLRPETLETRWDDAYVLVLLALVPLAGFATEGLRLLAVSPAWAAWSPVGQSVARLLAATGVSPQAAASLQPFLLYAHVLLGLLFIASIPFTKLRHLVLAPLNVVARPRRRASALPYIEDIEETETLGVGRISEFLPQQLLSFDACVNCGRCMANCPAALSEMPFSPCALIQSLHEATRNTLLRANGGDDALFDGAVNEDAPWFCTTCGACLTRCPTFVNPVEAIVDLRRYQVLTLGQIPRPVAGALRNMENQGNPWGIPGSDRTAWAKGLGVREIGPGEETDVLLFLGCAFAFDDRNQRVARAFVRLLQAADVDFAILGLDEACCGETARRLGHEYLFQVLAERNIELLQQVSFQRIVTQCPHCFNTLKNEYPQLGSNFVVEHYSDYLREIMPRLAPRLSAPNGAVGRLTYHDPCYLGRYNDRYDAPRALLDHVVEGRVEMARNRFDSFCCGGGGGQMWMENDAETRINHRRLEQALETGAETLAVSCPYCLIMFDDAIRSQGRGEQIRVFDITEIMAAQLTEESQ